MDIVIKHRSTNVTTAVLLSLAVADTDHKMEDVD